MKNLFPLLFCFFMSCSLYQDTESPEIYFEYSDFDILYLGRTISDIIISDNGQNLFLSDYNNNSLLNIDVSDQLKILGEISMGSHPIALDLNSDNSIIVIALEGESTIYTVGTQAFEIVNQCRKETGVPRTVPKLKRRRSYPCGA